MGIKLAAEMLGVDLCRHHQLLLSLCFLLAFFFLKLFIGRKPSHRRLTLPPGPPRLPVVGNLHQLLGELPHHSFRRLSDKYGPLMHLQLGTARVLVVSSVEMAQQVLRTHDLLFCDRAPLVSSIKFSYGGLDMAGAPYDDGLKQTRKLCMAELFNAKKVEWSRPIRDEEVGFFLSTIARLSDAGPVNLSEMFLSLFNNITRRQISGRRVSEEGERTMSPLGHMLLEINGLLGGFSAGDLFPTLAWLEVLSGRRARVDKSFHDIDRFLNDEIEDMQVAETNIDDNFIKTLLRLQKDPAFGRLLTRDKIKAILLDMFAGGSESSMSSLEWAMSELVMNPSAMKKAQEEVRGVAGKKEKLDEDDLHQLQYLKLVLKETWRLHAPAPLLIPRLCREDCQLGKYTIDAKTWVFVNVWAIGRDPKHWMEPEEFRPERFEDSSVDYRGQHFVLIPFGSGRRICPGMSLGVLGVELALANLLLRFDWELPGEVAMRGLDMEEALGLSNHRKSPLLLKATLATGEPH